jgi:hypothetical protein
MSLSSKVAAGAAVSVMMVLPAAASSDAQAAASVSPGVQIVRSHADPFVLRGVRIRSAERPFVLRSARLKRAHRLHRRRRVVRAHASGLRIR